MSISVPLLDPKGRLKPLKERVAVYPEPLRRWIVRDALWGVAFGLRAFAPKFAAAEDVYGTTGCLARFAAQLVMTLFALNRVYLVNDKTALLEVREFPTAPHDFVARLKRVLACPGHRAVELAASVEAMTTLFGEVVACSEGLYEVRYDV